MTQGFSNPIAGGGGALIRPNLHSPDFVTGVSGWSINKDGSAEFNGVVVRGTIIAGNGTTNTIILDSTRPALFMYDVNGKLIGSFAPGSGIDSFGNHYNGGVDSYDPNNIAVFSQLLAGLLQLSTGDPNQLQPALMFTDFNDGPGANQPMVLISSPSDSGVPTVKSALIELFGASVGATAPAFIRSRHTTAVAIDWLHQGEIKFSTPGAANYAETWHGISFAANWGNIGGVWSPGAYRMSNGGTVELDGAIQWLGAATAAPILITQLPVGYRPPLQKHLTVASMPAAGVTPQMETIEVRADGTMWITNYPMPGPTTPITLAGQWFPLGN